MTGRQRNTEAGKTEGFTPKSGASALAAKKNSGKVYLTADLTAWAPESRWCFGELGTPAGGFEPGGFEGSRLWFEKQGDCLLRKRQLKSGPPATWSLARPFKIVESSHQDSMQSQASF